MRIRDGRASVSVRCGRMSHTSTANPVANPQDVCPTVHEMWMGRGLKVGYESENLPAVVVRFCVLAIGTEMQAGMSAAPYQAAYPPGPYQVIETVVSFVGTAVFFIGILRRLTLASRV